MNKVKVTNEHKNRIKQELKQAGVSNYGLIKMEARRLPQIIHPAEHIEAVIYGIRNSYSVMLVATNLRVIYLDIKPLFTITDEITYDMVAGVAHNFMGNRAAVTLHTRVGEYMLKFVNRRAAEKFVAYIEERRVEHANGASANEKNQPAPSVPTVNLPTPLTEEAATFLHKNYVAVLSTIDRNGHVHGSVVYYFVDANNSIYILTKSETNKTHNIIANPSVAVTIYNTKKAQTLQLQGMGQIEPDPGVRDFVFRELSQPKKYKEKIDLPPVTKLKNGSFIVLTIKPTSAIYSDFS